MSAAKHVRRPWRVLRARSRLILVLVCLVLLTVGAYPFIDKYRATHQPQPLPAAHTTVTDTVSRPDETSISSDAAYEVPAGQPRRIILPTIKSSGFIQPVGLDGRGAVAAPNNINLAGWYTAEAVPGAEGLSIIDGHVQGKYAPGIFKNLARLGTGDRFEIEFGDHSRRAFEVMAVRSYPADQAGQRLLTRQPEIPRQLNLITCSGNYDKTASEYDQRLIVVAAGI